MGTASGENIRDGSRALDGIESRTDRSAAESTSGRSAVATSIERE